MDGADPRGITTFFVVEKLSTHNRVIIIQEQALNSRDHRRTDGQLCLNLWTLVNDNFSAPKLLVFVLHARGFRHECFFLSS